jgi:hypothetical protein
MVIFFRMFIFRIDYIIKKEIITNLKYFYIIIYYNIKAKLLNKNRY